jgi:hypothetical protein
MTRFRWLILALGLLVVIPVGVVLVLHYRSRDPHTAARQPYVSGSRQVNQSIERRAQQFLDALKGGDEGRLRGMAFGADDRANVSAFITAFGRRDDRRASLQTSDLGEKYGDLDIAVPCKDGSTQHAVVLFGWKRTSFISSGWYAFIDKPGTSDVLPNGCAAP